MTTATTSSALVSAALAEKLLDRACSAAPFLRGQVPAAAFAEACERSAAARFREARNPAGEEVRRYLESLHLSDLALAVACAEGRDAAWEHFIRTYRPDLYAAARAVAKGGNPHELADAIYAELFGLEERGGKRRSLFIYFHGRSKLSTWLRAIVAQRFVDQVRAARKMVSLDDSEHERGAGDSRPAGGAHRQGTLATQPAQDLDRARLLDFLQAAIGSCLGALEPRDRLRLSYYYAQDLTLAQIGRLMEEHEATVSRKLDRTRAELRKQIEAALQQQAKLSAAQIELCFEYAREQWPFDLSAALTKGP